MDGESVIGERGADRTAARGTRGRCLGEILRDLVGLELRDVDTFRRYGRSAMPSARDENPSMCQSLPRRRKWALGAGGTGAPRSSPAGPAVCRMLWKELRKRAERANPTDGRLDQARWDEPLHPARLVGESSSPQVDSAGTLSVEDCALPPRPRQQPVSLTRATV